MIIWQNIGTIKRKGVVITVEREFQFIRDEIDKKIKEA